MSRGMWTFSRQAAEWLGASSRGTYGTAVSPPREQAHCRQPAPIFLFKPSKFVKWRKLVSGAVECLHIRAGPTPSVRGGTQSKVRHSGISSVGDVPWGTHFCQFYEDKQDLIDILVPYFKAGLENNEMCLWVTSEPLRAEEAKAALAAEVQGLEQYIRNGQLEIWDSSRWYTSAVRFDSGQALRGLVDRIDAATGRGFDGLRASGNTVWQEKPPWQDVAKYEAAVDHFIGQNRMLALCTYSVGRCGASEILDLASNHAFALIKRGGKWQVIESAKRHLSEVSLRQSEERLRMAVASTGLGTWDFDPATGKLVWSDLCRGHFGLSPGTEVNYDTFLRGLHPDDRDRIHQIMQNALRPESGGHYVAEYRTIGIEDGQERWIASIGRAYFDRDGRPERIIGTTFDLTERKRMEEALRESQKLLKLVSDNLPCSMVYQVDSGEDGSSRTFTYVSAGVEQLHGISASEAMEDASAIYRQVHEEDRPMLAEVEAKCAAAMSVFQCEFRVSRPSGEINWRRVTSSPRKDARKHLVWEGLEIDITDRKLAEEALRESEEKYRLIFENSMDGIIITTGDGRVVAANSAACHILGRTEEEITLEGREGILDTSDSRYRPALEERLRTGRFRGELLVKHKDGTKIPVEGFAVLYRDNGGKTRSSIFFRDISQRKRAEERLREAQKLETVGLLAGGIAHDFNNLLMVIMGNAQVALDKDPSSGEIQQIITASEQAAQLTRQLLAYAGKGQFVARTFNLNDLVSRSTQLLLSFIPKRVDLVFNLSEQELLIKADPSQIEQILMNLVINAGEAIPPQTHGRVEIATRAWEVTPEIVREHAPAFGARPGQFVCLEVIDNGSGMDEATLARIFDPFFSTKFVGRGLGLAAVQGIVRSCKGFIDVHSSRGTGSTFRIYLPATAKKPAARRFRHRG